MSYVITCIINGVPHGIKANQSLNKFELMPIYSDTDVSKILSHPHRNGINDLLDWIKQNDVELAKHGLKVRDEQLYRK